MSLYLIDTENVGDASNILYDNNLTENDKVVFFFPNKRARSISLAEENTLKGIPYESKVINTKNEANSLDLAIASYAGIKINEYLNVYIIGNDRGYNIFGNRLHKELNKKVGIFKPSGKAVR